jgi:LAS superfamily LD-carboxypeptidase LdcB
MTRFLASRRSRLLLIGGVALVVAIAVVVAAVIVPSRLRADALAAVETAGEARDAALRDRDAAVETLDAALLDLAALVTAVDGSTAKGVDDLTDPAAEATLLAARDASVADGSVEQPEITTPDPDPRDLDVLPVDELTALAEQRTADADLLADETRALDDAASATEGAAESLGDALAVYLAAVTARGAAILADRADAAEDTRVALSASLEALPTASPVDAPATVDAYLAAAAAVIASSDAARAPVRSSRPGGVENPTSITVVVNKARPLPAGYVPPDLVVPDWAGSGGLSLRAEAARAVEALARDAAAAGISLRSVSSYRSYARQATIYDGYVAREGQAGADTHSARPGHSEHQTGLAVDFDDGAGCSLATCFRDTAGGRWLAENASRYGFILRYPDGYQHIVGYRFEPWHYRYVGVETAADMRDRGVVTLEEYFGLPAAPGY